jgi:hypothetical protein
MLSFHDFKSGASIDQTPFNVEATLFNSANKKLNIYALGGYSRDWNLGDNALQLGGGVRLVLGKHVNVFGEVAYQVWDKGENKFLIPFGIGFKF